MAAVLHSKAREVVDTLVRKLHTFPDFNISEIVEGGSLGHGTTVPSDYDIDLVIYSRSITGQEIVREGGNGCKKWLEKLHRFLREKFGADYHHIRMTTRSVQFKFKDIIDVDLLISPYWNDQHELYGFLQTVEDKSRFTVCASKWQVAFFKKFLSEHPQAREYIIKAKAWRNEKWPKHSGGSGRPSSFLISLLVIKAYQTNPHNVTQALIGLVEGAGPSFDITWDGRAYYQRCDYPNLLPSRPRVLDPANPANNVWKTGLKDYGKGERVSDYEPGDGKSTILKRFIRTIDLD